MTELPNPPSTVAPVFSEHDWSTAMPQLTKDMTEFLANYRTPIFLNKVTFGEGLGSGSFIEIEGSKYILTNEHVAAIRQPGQSLGFKLNNQDNLPLIVGNHVQQSWPWDLALLPVGEAAWTSNSHTSKAIQVDQLSLAHTPIATEVLAFSGFAGESTNFLFDSLHFTPTTSLAREAPLPTVPEWNSRFHFGIDYRPGLATNVLGKYGLPKPPGLSGSTVWNTCFVEAKAKGIHWTPELARVTGVVWGWSSTNGQIIATRIEHVRSFLLKANLAMKVDATTRI